MSLLEVENLGVAFDSGAGPLRVVEDVSFAVEPGERVAVVGESGSGKSVTALAIMGLLDERAGRVTGGTVRLDGVDLSRLDRRRLRDTRGARIAMVFQDAMTSLNPLLPIGRQVAESLVYHRGMSQRDARRRAVELLDQVRIPHAASQLRKYPHEFSGGMRQRVMIAAALSCEPALLIADEPTTALDVTVQAEILGLLDEVAADGRMAVLLITHDLGIVAQFADRIVVMYAGRVAESAPTATLFDAPAHPYTRALLAAVPRVDQQRVRRLDAIPGQLPPPQARGEGCLFAARCAFRMDRCATERPPLLGAGAGHEAACWLVGEPAPASVGGGA
jgi:oligopeptide/dipeptide ABC transporter ATP-binding protein